MGNDLTLLGSTGYHFNGIVGPHELLAEVE